MMMYKYGVRIGGGFDMEGRLYCKGIITYINSTSENHASMCQHRNSKSGNCNEDDPKSS